MQHCQRIKVFGGDPDVFHLVRKAAEVVGSCEVVDASQSDWHQDDIVVQFVSASQEQVALIGKDTPGNRTILVLKEAHGDLLQWLRKHPHLNHIMITCDRVSLWQLTSTIRKLSSSYPWGIQQYLTMGSEVHRFQIERFSMKQDCIRLLRETVARCEGYSDLPHIAASIASELIMNGVFAAPHDNDMPKYASHVRSEDLELPAAEQPVFSFGCDDDVLAIGVCDPFGKLNRDTVIEAWQRKGALQRRPGHAGAGVGLFSLLGLTHQLDFNFEKNVQTEVVALLGLHPRFRSYQQGGKAINFYSVTGDGKA